MGCVGRSWRADQADVFCDMKDSPQAWAQLQTSPCLCVNSALLHLQQCSLGSLLLAIVLQQGFGPAYDGRRDDDDN
jgi:hypothetical protein